MHIMYIRNNNDFSAEKREYDLVLNRCYFDTPYNGLTLAYQNSRILSVFGPK